MEETKINVKAIYKNGKYHISIKTDDISNFKKSLKLKDEELVKIVDNYEFVIKTESLGIFQNFLFLVDSDIRGADFYMCQETRLCFLFNEPIKISEYSFKLLYLIAKANGNPIEYDQIEDFYSNEDEDYFPAKPKHRIYNINKYFKKYLNGNNIILNYKNYGYRFNMEYFKKMTIKIK